MARLVPATCDLRIDAESRRRRSARPWPPWS